MITGAGNPKMNKTNALTLSNFQPRRGGVMYNKPSEHQAALVEEQCSAWL